MKEIRSLPIEGKLEESLKIPKEDFGVSERGLGDEKSEVSRERSTEVSCRSHEEYLKAISNS